MKIEGEMDMSKAMFVITHKSIEKKIELDDFYYLGVGNNKNNAEFKDSSMDNISEKNPHYCELTGLYWMWKNTNYEEIRLCHYRRFFCKIKQGMYKLCTVDELSCYLENVDIILPKKVNVYMDYFTFYEKCLRNDALRRCCELIIKKDKTYEKIINRLLRQNYYHCFNMFYCKKELMNEYCQWLFEILFDFEKKIDITEWSAQQRRVYGFIAEFLMNVWIEKKGLIVKEIDVAQSEEFPAPMTTNAEINVINPNFLKKILYKLLPIVWPLFSKRLIRKSVKGEK